MKSEGRRGREGGREGEIRKEIEDGCEKRGGGEVISEHICL